MLNQWLYTAYLSFLSTLMVSFILLTFIPQKYSLSKITTFVSALYAASILQMALPVAVRLSILFVSTLIIAIFILRLNINQSFWLTTMMLFFVMAADSFVTFFIRSKIDLALAPYPQYLVDTLHMALIFAVLFVIMLPPKKRIKTFIEKRMLLSKTQIIFPVTIVFSLIVVTLFLAINLEGNVFTGAPPLFGLGLTLGILGLSASISYFSIQYLIKINEMKKLEMKLNHLESSIRVKKGNFAFEKSIEFDLTQSESGQKICDAYTIETLIYSGKNSQVYRLKANESEDQFTLKAIEKIEDIDYRFNELEEINHPKIVGIKDHFDGNYYHYVLKAYVHGHTLYEQVLQHGAYKENEALKIAFQIIEALKYLHFREHPIVFRDLKPSNIIVNEMDEIFLIDLESVRRKANRSDSDTFVVGTKGYASPEQYGYSQSTPKSDIYAFGATLFFLLTGETPDVNKINALNGDASMSEPLLETIKRCVKFSPDERFDSVETLEAHLKTILT